MGKRAAAAAQTRDRIVAATMQLHAEQGVAATSWDDIAKRAGVGVGTVYRHFPSLDELLPACGGVAFELLALPDADCLFDGLAEPERVAGLVGEAFGIYERGAPIVEELERVRDFHPNLAEALEAIEQALDALVREAALDADPARVRALIDVRTWRAFERQGLSNEAIRDTVAGLIGGLRA